MALRAGLVACLLLAACDGGTREVTLRWTFAGGQGCDAAGVRTVHVFIGPLAPAGAYDHEVECTAGERALKVQGVALGAHVLVLKGLAHDHVLYTLTKDVDVRGATLGGFDLPPYAPPTFY